MYPKLQQSKPVYSYYFFTNENSERKNPIGMNTKWEFLTHQDIIISMKKTISETGFDCTFNTVYSIISHNIFTSYVQYLTPLYVYVYNANSL